MSSHILIVSNEALSERSSNGRTLLNFLEGIPAENIAQFCLRGIPDENACSAYYKVTDRDALNAIFMKKRRNEKAATEKSEPRPKNRSCRNLCLRDFVWRTYCWWTKDFTRFLRIFAPTVILFQAGDAPFMFEIAMRIAKQFNIPLVMYSSENYVLKEVLFSTANPKSPWHWLLKRRLKSSYKRMMETVSYCIYITEYLEDSFQQAYPHAGKSSAIYTASKMKPIKPEEVTDFSLLYCGNLGVGRVESLCQIAQVLYQIDPKAKLKIYGNFPKEEEKEELCAMPNVMYGGTVPYSQIPGLMKKGSMLVHCENSAYLEDLIGAFSTKIADSLACGRPFLVYADRAYPFVQYLMKYDCAHIASDKEELETILRRCMADETYRYQYVERAIKTAEENHNSQRNCGKMREILIRVAGKSNN